VLQFSLFNANAFIMKRKFYPRGYKPKYVLMNKIVSAAGYIDLPGRRQQCQE
jgi:hypothetical protein